MAHARPVPQLPWGWRSMWVIAMFDLPTDTPRVRKAYVRFRKGLLDDGFTLLGDLRCFASPVDAVLARLALSTVHFHDVEFVGFVAAQLALHRFTSRFQAIISWPGPGVGWASCLWKRRRADSRAGVGAAAVAVARACS